MHSLIEVELFSFYSEIFQLHLQTLYPFHLFYIFQLQVLLILYLKSIFLDHKHWTNCSVGLFSNKPIGPFSALEMVLLNFICALQLEILNSVVVSNELTFVMIFLNFLPIFLFTKINIDRNSNTSSIFKFWFTISADKYCN